MSPFMHLFVVVLTVASILGCLWLLLAQSRGKTGPETTHVWDDDLTEYNHPLPRWWLHLFLLTIAFAVGYLVFYPGLGTVQGRLGWSSEAEMQARLDQLTAQRQAQYAPLGRWRRWWTTTVPATWGGQCSSRTAPAAMARTRAAPSAFRT